MINKIISVFSFIIIIVSLFFCGALIYDLMNPGNSDTDTGVLIGLMIFFSATLAAGFFMMFKARSTHHRHSYEKIEKEILSMISRKEGRITPEEIALDSQMTVEDAKGHLDRLCENGSGELQVTESGRLVYVFFGFITTGEKEGARSALDL